MGTFRDGRPVTGSAVTLILATIPIASRSCSIRWSSTAKSLPATTAI